MESELEQIKMKLLNTSVLFIEESYHYADERDEISGYPVLTLRLANGDKIELGLAEYNLETLQEQTKRAQERKLREEQRQKEREEIRQAEIARSTRAKVRDNIRI